MWLPWQKFVFNVILPHLQWLWRNKLLHFHLPRSWSCMRVTHRVCKSRQKGKDFGQGRLNVLQLFLCCIVFIPKQWCIVLPYRSPQLPNLGVKGRSVDESEESGHWDQKLWTVNRVWTSNQVTINRKKLTLQKPMKIRDLTISDEESEMTLNRVTKRQ